MPAAPHDPSQPTPPAASASSERAARRRELRPTRDALATIREDGSHRFLHTADVGGRFTTARRWSGWLLIVVYLALPWIQVGGHPAVFLDVATRHFHLFGITLAFQDSWVLFFGITGLGFALFFLTALLGRVWCGWGCPQTVFLDHIYRRIERFCEGDAPARRELDRAPWTAGKIVRRGGKHTLYLAASAAISHLFLAYFVSLPELWSMMRTAPGDHIGSFVFVAVFTGVLYGNFAWFREQLCVILCPYGRLQSALIDDHSLVIGYDTARGEPRGKLSSAARHPDVPQASSLPPETHLSPAISASALSPPASALGPLPPASLGACIDCDRCVRVCPTGIDIRQGLQLECIGCAACIDACDIVMTRLARPTGLIRYDSLAGLRGAKTRWIRPRTVIYAALLGIGAVVAAVAISTLRPANLEVTRLGGAPYFVDAASVRNQFLVRLVNKRGEPVPFVLTLSDPSLAKIGWDEPVTLAPLAEEVRPLVVQIPLSVYAGSRTLRIDLTDPTHGFTLSRTVNLLGPDPALLKKTPAHAP